MSNDGHDANANDDMMTMIEMYKKVDAYVSRDLDSLINSREAAAVAEW